MQNRTLACVRKSFVDRRKQMTLQAMCGGDSSSHVFNKMTRVAGISET